MLQYLLAQAQRLGRDLDELVVGDEFDGLFEIQRGVGNEADRIVGCGSAHIGHLLFAHHVHVEVVVARVLADDHALVNLDSRPDEENAAFLQAVERVCGRHALAVGDQRARRPLRNLALVRDVAVKERVHYDGSARFGQHLAAQADEAAAGHAKLQSRAARTVIVHLRHLTLARAQFLDHHANEPLRHVDGEMLNRFHAHAVYDLRDDLRPPGHQLEAFAPHHLNQDRELQLAAAQHLEAVGRAGLLHTDGHVGEQFFVEALAQIPAGDVLPFAAGKGRSVDIELNCNGRLVDDDERQRRGILDAGDGFTDRDAFTPATATISPIVVSSISVRLRPER